MITIIIKAQIPKKSSERFTKNMIGGGGVGLCIFFTTDARRHARAHARTHAHAHPHTHTRAHTHTRTHARTNTHSWVTDTEIG